MRYGVKAYIRITNPYYEFPLTADGHLGEGGRASPDGLRGYWWHESLRVLAAMKECVLVLLSFRSPHAPHPLSCTNSLPRVRDG